MTVEATYKLHQDVEVCTVNDEAGGNPGTLRAYLKLLLNYKNDSATSNVPPSPKVTAVAYNFLENSLLWKITVYLIDPAISTTSSFGVSLGGTNNNYSLSLDSVGYYITSASPRYKIHGLTGVDVTPAGSSTSTIINYGLGPGGKVWVPGNHTIKTIYYRKYEDLNWNFLCDSAFGLDDQGRLCAIDACIDGQVRASSGNIGELSINNTGLIYSDDASLIKLDSTGYNINDSLYIGTDNWIKTRTNSGIYFPNTLTGRIKRKLILKYGIIDSEGKRVTEEVNTIAGLEEKHGQYTSWYFQVYDENWVGTWASKGHDIKFTVWVQTQDGTIFDTIVTIPKETSYSSNEPYKFTINSSKYTLGKQLTKTTFESFNAYGFSVDPNKPNTMYHEEWTSGELELDFKGNLLPINDSTYDLGSTELKWKNAYFSGDIKAGNWAGNLLPSTSDAYDLGSVDAKWQNAYFSKEVQAKSFYATSDKRLKENLEAYQSEKSILDLPIYKYDFIGGDKNQIGCLAQDLQEICPEIVEEKEDGYLAIQESKIVYLLLDEVKQLKAEVKRLKEDKT